MYILPIRGNAAPGRSDLSIVYALSDPDLLLRAFSYAFLHEFFPSIAALKSSVVQFFIILGALMNYTCIRFILLLGALLPSNYSFAELSVGAKAGIITTGVIAAGVLAQPPPYGLWSFFTSSHSSVEAGATYGGIEATEVEYSVVSSVFSAEAEALGTGAEVAGASEAGSVTTTTATGATAATVGLMVIAVVVVVVIVAVATISLWLPPILKQSGVANSTLYEVDAYIDFQGAVGSSCSRAHLVMYPYSRKDLGAPWRVVGGDRGRACIPERYGARIDIPSRGTLVQLRGSTKDAHKNIKKIGLEAPTAQRKGLHLIWSNA